MGDRTSWLCPGRCSHGALAPLSVLKVKSSLLYTDQALTSPHPCTLGIPGKFLQKGAVAGRNRDTEGAKQCTAQQCPGGILGERKGRGARPEGLVCKAWGPCPGEVPLQILTLHPNTVRPCPLLPDGQEGTPEREWDTGLAAPANANRLLPTPWHFLFHFLVQPWQVR